MKHLKPVPDPLTPPIKTGGEVIVIGAGIAGIMTALRLSPRPVTLIAKAPLGAGASTTWAQAGFAAALGRDDDTALHAADTREAGAGICEGAIVDLMTRAAPARIRELAALGVPFDQQEDGAIALHREAAHSASRIVGVEGDRTGRAFMDTVVPLVRKAAWITVIEGVAVDALAMAEGRVAGVVARPVGPESDIAGPTVFTAKAVVIATGGAGGLYDVTTNPSEATGDGIAMAARAGAVLADLEFVQFHPTAMAVGLSPAPLATEAIRGKGAVLVTDKGERFMAAIHPDAELAPRDVVARAIARQIRLGRRVYLDCREAIGERFAQAFPTVYASCRKAGIDPARELIPVAPAAHYHMGGISTDADGRTTVPGLWACGEAASAGVHGANRLASNSMLDGLVFSARAAEAIGRDIDALPTPSMAGLQFTPVATEDHKAAEKIAPLRALMAAGVGVVRNADALARAIRAAAGIEREAEGRSQAVANAALAARLIATAAYLRCESRGGHFREDYPVTDPKQARRSRLTLAEADALLGELEARQTHQWMQGQA